MDFIKKLLFSVVYLCWTSIALFLSLIIIYFFDKDPGSQFLLLPEWGLLAFFILMSTLKKQELICMYQDDYVGRVESARNLFNLLSVFCVLLFSLSLMAGRGYINDIQIGQKNVIMYSNVLLFFASCLFYVISVFEESKILRSAKE